MELHIFIIAWICAILAMTGFSTIITYLWKCECREPVLLAQLVSHFTKESTSTNTLIKGWAIHFAVGLLFMFFYELLWALSGVERMFLWSVLFGMLIGFIGIGGWMFMFRFHPDTSKVNFKIYYIQLFFAHIIFSLTALAVYLFL